METLTLGKEVSQTWSFRGSKSRNKVSVGEPAEGSLNNFKNMFFLAEQLVIFIMSPLKKERKKIIYSEMYLWGLGLKKCFPGEFN